MSQTHRKNLEQQFGVDNEFENRLNENNEDKEYLDGIELQNLKEDKQYQQLMKDFTIQGPSKGNELEILPKYQGVKISSKQFKESALNKLITSQNQLPLKSDNKKQGNSQQLSQSNSEQDQKDQQNPNSDDDNEFENSDENDDNDNENQDSLEGEEQEEEEGEEEENNDIEKEQDENSDQDDEENKGEIGSIKRFAKDQQSKAMTLFKSEKVNTILSNIEKEDEEALPSTKAEIENEKSKAQQVKTQIQLFKDILLEYFSLQKALNLVKKMPLPNILAQFKSQTKMRKYLQILILDNIDFIQKIKIELAKKSSAPTSEKDLYTFVNGLAQQITEKDISYEQYEKEFDLNLDCMTNLYLNQNPETKKWIDQNITQWSQKTNIISQNLKKSGMEALIQTPIGQAQKALKNYNFLLQKSQLKRDVFRILGTEEDNLNQQQNVEIFDDGELYHELLKNYMNELNQMDQADEEGLVMNNTKLYLLKRKLQKQEQFKKKVDRKASKGRKIRYIVYDKIVNFMTPKENTHLLDGRNEIVQCLFGKRIDINDEEEQNNIEIQENEPSLVKKFKKITSESDQQSLLDKDKIQLV